MWDTGYQPLLKYADREGDCRVPRGYSEDDILLETWVVNQRRRKHQWSPERMALLEDVPGWVWETGHEPVTRWDGKFEVLLKYVDREKHVSVPRKHVGDGVHLGQWVRARRQDYRNGKLSPERGLRLNLGRMGLVFQYWGKE